MSMAYHTVIVGAGMAGASLAAALAQRGAGHGVLLAEAEPQPGYHTTGRSAAFWVESYGGPAIQPLTTASGPVLHQLGVMRPRAALTLARADQASALDAFVARFVAAGVGMARLDRAGIDAQLPGLPAHWHAAAWEPSCCDIDVAGLHQHYLAQAKAGGVALACKAGVRGLARMGDGWQVRLDDGQQLGGQPVSARVVVNAAGAWADSLAQMAGVRPVGIAPLRRTMVQARVAPAPMPSLPLVLDLDESFYFKPENGRLWLTPHDETPSPPCDAAPDELDVATGIARVEAATGWAITHVEHKWAGLRSFAPDRLPVFGWDGAQAGFFWFAGQGGFGIQTAPAAAAMGAALLLGQAPGPIDPAPFSPTRF